MKCLSFVIQVRYLSFSAEFWESEFWIIFCNYIFDRQELAFKFFQADYKDSFQRPRTVIFASATGMANFFCSFLSIQSEREIRACHTVPHHQSKRGRGRQSRVLNWRMTVFLVTFNFCRTKVEAKVSCSWWTSRKNTASHSTGKLAITILVFWRKSPSLLCNIHRFMHGVLEVGNTCKALGQHFIGNGQQH